MGKVKKKVHDARRPVLSRDMRVDLVMAGRAVTCDVPGCPEAERERLEIHHVLPVSVHPLHHVSNLVFLCRGHHALVEHFYWIRRLERTPEHVVRFREIQLGMRSKRYLPGVFKARVKEIKGLWKAMHASPEVRQFGWWSALYAEARAWARGCELLRVVNPGEVLFEENWFARDGVSVTAAFERTLVIPQAPMLPAPSDLVSLPAPDQLEIGDWVEVVIQAVDARGAIGALPLPDAPPVVLELTPRQLAAATPGERCQVWVSERLPGGRLRLAGTASGRRPLDKAFSKRLRPGLTLLTAFLESGVAPEGLTAEVVFQAKELFAFVDRQGDHWVALYRLAGGGSKEELRAQRDLLTALGRALRDGPAEEVQRLLGRAQELAMGKRLAVALEGVSRLEV